MNENTAPNRFADLELDPANLDSVIPPEKTPLPLEIDGVEIPPCVEAPHSKPAFAALTGAGYDFNVELIRPEFPLTALPLNSNWVNPPNIDDYRLCMRMDTGHIFGVVSPGYGFVQPHELAETVDAALPEGAGKVKCEGSSFGDSMWFDCELPTGTFDISPEMQSEANGQRWIHLDPRDPQGNIPIRAKLLFKHAYGGQGSYDVSLLIEALVCANGLCLPLKNGKKQISIRHNSSFPERVEQLRHAFQVAGGCVPVFAGMLSEMAATKITMPQFDAYAKVMFPGESTQAKNKRERFSEIYVSALGAAPGTAWGALQASTYYATHETPVRVGGRSLSRYTLDDPSTVTGQQLDGYQRQARLELLVNGAAGQFTEKAYQYVTTNMLEMV